MLAKTILVIVIKHGRGKIRKARIVGDMQKLSRALSVTLSFACIVYLAVL